MTTGRKPRGLRPVGFFRHRDGAFLLGETRGWPYLDHSPMATKTEEKTSEDKVTAARNKNWKIRMRVGIAIAIPAGVHDHRIVQDRVPVCIVHLRQLLKELGEICHVMFVDLRDHLQVFQLAAMMRQIVMPFRHADVGE